MEVNKIIKRWGQSSVIVLTKEDLKIMKKKIGDIIKFEVKA